jgi:hypothetical protein
MLPWTGLVMIVAPLTGALAGRLGDRVFMVGGLVLQTAGMGWIALVAEPDVGYGSLVPALLLSGVGVSMAIVSSQGSVIGSVHADAAGKAAGTNTMMRELGGVFGIAIVVAVFAGAGSVASPQLFTDGFVPAIAVCAGLALADRPDSGERRRGRDPSSLIRRSGLGPAGTQAFERATSGAAAQLVLQRPPRVGLLDDLRDRVAALLDDGVAVAPLHELLRLEDLVAVDDGEAPGVRTDLLVLRARELDELGAPEPAALADEGQEPGRVLADLHALVDLAERRLVHGDPLLVLPIHYRAH